MTKVYISSTGSYSDWSISGIFSTREKAERFQQLANAAHEEWWHDFNDIEEHELDDILDMHDKGYHQFNIQMFSDGRVEYSGQNEIGDYWNGPRWSFGERRHPAGGHIRVINADIWARDMAEAVKIVNERRLIVIAEDKWGDDKWLEEVTRG